VGSIRVIDDVLDRFALRHDRADQVLQDGLVIGMVGIGGQPFLVRKVRHEREVGVTVLDADIATETVRENAWDLAGELVQGSLDFGDVRRSGFGLPTEEGDVT
jgi:hypothetical protein